MNSRILYLLLLYDTELRDIIIKESLGGKKLSVYFYGCMSLDGHLADTNRRCGPWQTN